MIKKRGLGINRGLDALLGNISAEKKIIAGAQSLVASAASEQTETKPTASKKTTKVTKKSTADKKAGNDNPALKVGVGEQVALVQIATNRLQSGKYQPRRDMNEAALNELSLSIKQHGVMQPIVIRPLLSDESKSSDTVTHEIIAGERRWRAAKLAGLESIPAIERVLSDEVAIALALIENIQREDLNVLEQAAALQRFHTEFGMRNHTI